MNSPDAAAGPWCCYNGNAGEATAAVLGESGSLFDDVVADYSTDDLFELVWEQGGQAGTPAAVSCLWSPRFSSKPPTNDVRFDPPSEDEMAAWLRSIVKGEELACNDSGGGGGGGRPMADDGRLPDVAVPPVMGTLTEMDKKGKQFPTTTTTEGTMMMGNKEMRKAPAGESSRRSHHGEAHSLTEKRRRHKINERLKTLQQLVPGCSKSNQASTLDQTIHYMKSLQHQVQAMSVGLAVPAVYPVSQPQSVAPGTPVAVPFPSAPTMVLGGHPLSTTMVPFRTTMLQLPHYPGAAVMMPAAAVAPMYLATAPTSTAVAPGDAMSDNRLHGSLAAVKKEERAA